ncbi:MAG: hypothetical protein AAFQ17_06500 [Pseudomonadota bacterium]
MTTASPTEFRHLRDALVERYGSFRGVAEAIDLHPETVRRYLRSNRPGTEMLVRLAKQGELSPVWLMLGEGPIMREQLPDWYATQVSTSSLWAELERRIQSTAIDVRTLLEVKKLDLNHEETGESVPSPSDGEATRTVPDHGASTPDTAG